VAYHPREVKTDDLKIDNGAKLLTKTTDVAFMYPRL
jgi:hypothetical protein